MLKKGDIKWLLTKSDTDAVDIYYDAADADNELLKVRIEISDNDGAEGSGPSRHAVLRKRSNAKSLFGDLRELVASARRRVAATFDRRQPTTRQRPTADDREVDATIGNRQATAGCRASFGCRWPNVECRSNSNHD